LRFGICVSADAAALFAAALDFGLRRTFPAADAARLLVTSEFRLLVMPCIPSPVDRHPESS
jgi:hypothetical protein